MDRWSPFEQPFPHPICGSPHLSTVPPEDSLNTFGASNPNPLIPPCGLLPASDPATTSGLTDPTYETLLPPNHPSKETEFYDDNLFNTNRACKDNLMGGQNFLQAQGSATRAEAFPSDNTHGFSNQIPSQCQPNIKRGSFGVLPHESVNNLAPKFGTQSSSVSYKNGPFTDNDGSNNLYSSAPLSAQSAFSGDTTSLSPVMNPVASPVLSNFSSPSDYYSSPKQNFVNYNSTRSPVPLSPSVAQSFPSSPFANVDPVGHISSAPPMSPLSSRTYMNSINNIPQRNGQNPQLSPTHSSANMCYNQEMTYGPQPMMRKTPPDYHSDYNAFAHDHNPSSSYNSVYPPPMHPGHMSSGSNARVSQRAHTPHPNSMSHDARMTYGNSNTMAHTGMSSPPYMQNQVSHDNSYGAYPSSINPGQSMHPPRYPPPMNTNQNNNLHLNPSSTMLDQQFNFLSEPEPPKHYDSFGVPGNQHNPRNSHYLGSDMGMIERDESTTNRQLQSSDHEEHQNPLTNLENTTRTMAPTLPVSKDSQNEVRSFGTLNYNYGSSQLDPIRRGNFSLSATGRRRGRRGRRRKADINCGNIPRYQPYKDRNMYSNGYPHQSNSNSMLDYGRVNSFDPFSKRLCDEKELPPMDYPFSRYRSELKMIENQKKNLSIILSKPAKKCVSIEEELSFLGHLKFSDESDNDYAHTFMKTRNKDSEGFLQCYKNFLASRKTKPASIIKPVDVALQSKNISKDGSHSSKEQKSQKILPKIIIKRDFCNKHSLNWRLEKSVPDPSSGDESASESSEDIPISSQIKKENDAEGKSKRLKHSSKFNKVSKCSANSKKTAHCDKSNEIGECSQINSEIPLAGQVRVKAEIESSPECEMESAHSPRKKGKKSKSSESSKRAKKSHSKHLPTDASESGDFVPVKIKQEVLDDDDVKFEGTRRTLRSRKTDAGTSLDPIPGPSTNTEKENDSVKESINISSDDDIELCDDSDSDPAWTPSAKPQKGVDHAKTVLQLSPKRRGPKPGRRSSAGSAIPRQKKEKPEGFRKRSTSERGKKGPSSRTSTVDPNIKAKKEKERFLIAKEDLDKETPFLWRIDKETNMLQRFEWYEQQGIILYRSTYTYAAWNENSYCSYVTANVRIISHSRVLFVVEYLGPDHTTKVENPAFTSGDATTAPTSINPLRENFEVFLQTLISQALDPNFLTEITNENDEYFLSNIKEIESVTERKKQALNKENWEESVLKSVNTYPSVDVIQALDAGDCEVCKKDKVTILLQLHGQPYDSVTLGSVEAVLPPQAQYNVCDLCSATMSLYCRLQHQKYNFFVKCRGKMNDVIGATSDNVESHVLLEECLQDHAWVNALFAELEALWKQCDRKS